MPDEPTLSPQAQLAITAITMIVELRELLEDLGDTLMDLNWEEFHATAPDHTRSPSETALPPSEPAPP